MPRKNSTREILSPDSVEEKAVSRRPVGEETKGDNGNFGRGQGGTRSGWPAAGVAIGLSLLATVHLGLVMAGYLSVVRPTTLQMGLIERFGFYLRGLHLLPEPASGEETAIEGVAFYLARGEGEDRAYRLRFSDAASGDESVWYDAPLPMGFAGGERWRRHGRFLGAIASLGVADQNDLVARWLLPIVRRYPAVKRLRVVRLPNIMTNVVQDSEPPVYAASVLRDGEEVRFVREPQPRLGSRAGG